MGKPSPPAAPDYAGAAKEQGIANVDAAKAQGKINNPNVVNPYGTQTVTWGSPDDDKDYQQALWNWNNVNTVGPMPQQSDFAHTPNLVQKFSPEQQALYDQSTQNQQLLGLLGRQGINAAQGVIGRQVDYSGIPAMPGSYDALRSKVYDANMARANQDISVNRDNLNAQLVASGLHPGTPAYDNAMRNVDRQQVDAGQQAQLNAGNQAQQAYGMDLQSRQQGLNEYNAKRSIPLNEIVALLSGSQVSNPFQMPGYAQNANVAPAPTYAAANAAGQYGTDIYNAQQAQQGNTQSGLFGLGGSGIMAAGMFM